MDWLVNFPEALRVPLESWINTSLDFVTTEFATFFAVVRTALIWMLVRIEGFLQWLPWTVVVVGLGALGWKLQGWKLAAGVATGLVFIGVLGLWDLTMTTVAVVVVAALLAIVMGIPIGIAMSRSSRLEGALRPVLDFMQTMPSFVYLVPAIALFSIGKVPGLFATWIYAIPPVIRLTNLGIRQVPHETVEAAQAFGSTPGQTLRKVQLPLAFPTIMAGVNQTIMMALAMVVIASIVGAGGLGNQVLIGLGRLNTGQAFAAGLGIVIVAMIIDRMAQSVTADVGPRQNIG